MESQVFDPKAFSLSPVDLVDADIDNEDLPSEADQRMARYARLGKLIDRDDLKQMVLARLLESAAFDVAVEDALETPIAMDRIDVHVSDRIRLADALYAEIRDAADELLSLLEVVEG